jgi:hypothetical protein
MKLCCAVQCTLQVLKVLQIHASVTEQIMCCKLLTAIHDWRRAATVLLLNVVMPGAKSVSLAGVYYSYIVWYNVGLLLGCSADQRCAAPSTDRLALQFAIWALLLLLAPLLLILLLLRLRH